jgi:3alpha(or 20beta)-hydroxysteroid dehydrogenase
VTLTLHGKVGIITGAARGMGEAHARTFVGLGAKVAITDLRREEGKRLAEELGANAAFFEHDVSEPDQWNRVVAGVKDLWGPVTVLVNNAGVPGPVAQTATLTTEDYLRVVSVDQHGVFFGMRAVIPQMIEAGSGSIINIASMAGFAHVRGVPNPGYTAAKSAVRGLTRAAAVEYGGHGIRVNCVMPGAVATPLLIAESPTGMTAAQSGEGRPLQRPAEAQEIANVVAFLASDLASYVTGIDYFMDGGKAAGGW